MLGTLQKVAILALPLALLACTHEVIQLSHQVPPFQPPPTPIPLTAAVVPGSFERGHLNGPGVTQKFARSLRKARIFQGVMHPVPAGVDPRWQIELSGSTSLVEPDDNFWRSFFATALPPLGLVIWLEEEFTLELEALLLDRRQLVNTYRSEVKIRHRYQVNANKPRMKAESLGLSLNTAMAEILAALAQDATQLAQLNEQQP